MSQAMVFAVSRVRNTRIFLLTLLLVCVGWQCVAQGPVKPADKKPQQEETEVFIMEHKDAVPSFVETSPQTNGEWVTSPFMIPFNPVHMALMYTGKVLVVSGSGNDPTNTVLEAGVWDPGPQTVTTFHVDWDMFCNGMIILPDGRPFVMGGTISYTPFRGFKKTALFDPATEKFTNGPDMSGGRWYPTATVLGTGSAMVLSGIEDTSGAINTTVQIGDGTTWTAAGTAFKGVPLYPREHVLPNGKVFESGSNPDSQMYDPVAFTWTFVANTIFGLNRVYGSSVLLPLTPANGFKPTVMIMGGANMVKGGSNNATNTTELIDLSVASPAWVSGPNMVGARVQMNATILPNGKVLVSGGSNVNEDPTTAVLQSEIYDPATNTFSPASTMQFAREYHSNTLLLPDGTVMAAGSNPVRGRATYEPHIEIYKPAYLFDSTGKPAKRPVIAPLASTAVKYGAKFAITTTDAANIKTVVLIRAAAVTHSFDMDQRLVGLKFTTKPGVLTATAPANGNLAPPGYYLLFIVDTKGVPSVARFVQLGP